MNLIVAVDKNFAIGYKGELLASVRADLKNFQKLTTGKTVVYGSKTLSTFPGGRVLKNRENVIISRNSDFQPEGGIVVHSVEELLSYVKEKNSEDVFVIGGASIYNQLLPYCDTAYITKFDKSFENFDATIPNLDKDPSWEMVECGEEMKSVGETDTIDGMSYYFTKYVRIKNEI